MTTKKLIAHAEALIAEAEEHWLTPKQYSELVGCHVQTVYDAIRRGIFPWPVKRPTGGHMVIVLPNQEYRALNKRHSRAS